MCLLVEGAPGVGRTRLLQEAVRIGRTEGFEVVRVQADELDQYASRSALPAALREAGEGDGEGPEQGVAEQPFWVLDRIAEILERRVRLAPVSVVVDDAQWADPTTLSALRALPKRLVDSRILWILGMQTASGRSLARRARDYLEENGATRLVLRPLDTEAITRIAADLRGRAPESGLAPLLRDVHGNPFLVVELLRALEGSGGLDPIACCRSVPCSAGGSTSRRPPGCSTAGSEPSCPRSAPSCWRRTATVWPSGAETTTIGAEAASSLRRRRGREIHRLGCGCGRNLNAGMRGVMILHRSSIAVVDYFRCRPPLHALEFLSAFRGGVNGYIARFIAALVRRTFHAMVLTCSSDGLGRPDHAHSRRRLARPARASPVHAMPGSAFGPAPCYSAAPPVGSVGLGSKVPSTYRSTCSL